MADPNPKITIKARNQTDRAFRAARGNLKDFKKSAVSLTSTLAALAGAAGFGALIKSNLDAQDEIGKLSTRLGASTEALSQYKFIAKQTGVEFRTLTLGWQRATRRISEAANGTGEAKDALKELGLNAQTLNQLAPEKQFEALGDAIRKVEKPADRVRLAMKLFDSEGVALLQTLEKNGDELERMKARATELGITLSREQTDAAATAKDAMAELQAAFNGLSTTLTTEAAPALAEITEQLTDFIPKAAGWAEKITETMGVAGTFIWEILNPSDVTGRPTIVEAMDRAVAGAADLAQGLHEVKKARDGAMPGADSLPDLGINNEVTAKQKKQLEDFAFEDKRVHHEILETRYYRNVLANQREFDLQFEFENAKTRLVRHGVIERNRFEMMAAREKTNMVLTEMTRLTAGVAFQSKTLFKINKLAALSQALLNLPESASNAYNWGTRTGGPYLGAAMAAIAVAAQVARIQAIKSQSFGGGGSGSTASGGFATPPAPSDLLPAQSTQQQAAPQIRINVEGNVFANDDWREAMIEQLQEALNNDEITPSFS